MKAYKNTTTGVAWTFEEIKKSFEQFRSEIEESKGKSYSDFEEYLEELLRDGELEEVE